MALQEESAQDRGDRNGKEDAQTAGDRLDDFMGDVFGIGDLQVGSGVDHQKQEGR